MKSLRKALFVLVLFFLSFLFSCVSAGVSLAATVSLPNIDGWICENVRVTSLDTVSGNRGTWLERDYRNSGGVPFHAVLLSGSAVKGWNISNNTVSNDDGPYGSGASYKTTSVLGYKAIIEYHPIMGYTLCVNLEKQTVLTLESRLATEEEIKNAALTIAEKITGK